MILQVHSSPHLLDKWLHYHHQCSCRMPRLVSGHDPLCGSSFWLTMSIFVRGFHLPLCKLAAHQPYPVQNWFIMDCNWQGRIHCWLLMLHIVPVLSHHVFYHYNNTKMQYATHHRLCTIRGDCMEWHCVLKTVYLLCEAFNLSIVCDVCSCWLSAMRFSSSSTIPLHSKCLLNWCGRSETGWTPTACCCTTTTWSSCSPTAPRARTSTQRSSALVCCHSMTSSKLSLTPTAYLRYWLLR